MNEDVLKDSIRSVASRRQTRHFGGTGKVMLFFWYPDIHVFFETPQKLLPSKMDGISVEAVSCFCFFCLEDKLGKLDQTEASKASQFSLLSSARSLSPCRSPWWKGGNFAKRVEFQVYNQSPPTSTNLNQQPKPAALTNNLNQQPKDLTWLNLFQDLPGFWSWQIVPPPLWLRLHGCYWVFLSGFRTTISTILHMEISSGL